jgi:hypothetical protein
MNAAERFQDEARREPLRRSAKPPKHAARTTNSFADAPHPNLFIAPR